MRICFFLLLFVPFCFVHSLATFQPTSPSLVTEGLFFSSSSSIALRAGYEGSFVFDRRMKQERELGRIDDTKMDTHLGIAVIDAWNRLDFYGGAGQGRIRSDWRVNFPQGMISRIVMETHYGWSWSVGANGICYQYNNATLALGGRYLQSNPEILWMTKDGQPLSFGKESEVQWKEWQINASLAYKIDFLVPYLGLKYSHAHAHLLTRDNAVPLSSDGKESLSMESRKNWGIVLGCGLSNGKYFQLNVEARLFDEEGGAVYGDFRF